MRLVLARTLAALALGAASTLTQAGVFVVDALANNAGNTTRVGVPTIALTAGDLFSVTASPTDLWNAGPLPRWSNADGLVVNLFASGSDESGRPAGTQIGQVFAPLNQLGLIAPYGSLVGEIANQFRFLGTSFTGPAWATGTLNLFYWDEGQPIDNTGTVSATVVSVRGEVTEPGAVPVPATLALLGLGALGLVAASRRRAGR